MKVIQMSTGIQTLTCHLEQIKIGIMLNTAAMKKPI